MPGEMTAGTPRTLPRTSPIPPRIVLVSHHRCLSQRRTPRRGTIRRRARPDARFADMCFPRDRGEITRLSSPPTVADRIPPHVSPSDNSGGPATRSSAPPVPPPSASSPSTAVPFTSSPTTDSRRGTPRTDSSSPSPHPPSPSTTSSPRTQRRPSPATPTTPAPG